MGFSGQLSVPHPFARFKHSEFGTFLFGCSSVLGTLNLSKAVPGSFHVLSSVLSLDANTRGLSAVRRLGFQDQITRGLLSTFRLVSAQLGT